jgi:hypothetical protein
MRLRHEKIALIVDRVFLSIRTTVKALAACYALHEGHELIKSLANGKINWSVVLLAILKGDLARILLIAITAISILVAFNERRLRRTVIAEHSAYIKALERRFDADRSSSRLSSDGRTRLEDLDGN